MENLEGWEFISYDEILDSEEYDLFSTKHVKNPSNSCSDVFNTNHISPTSSKSKKKFDNDSILSKQANKGSDDHNEEVKKVMLDTKSDQLEVEADQENIDSDIEVKDEKVDSWKETDDMKMLWKRKLSGIGAICSFAAAAAATICIVVLGSSPKNRQIQKLLFQIYASDAQQARRLNEVKLAAARGITISRAHISFGGCYGAHISFGGCYETPRTIYGTS